MTSKDIFNALSEIDEEFIEEYAPKETENSVIPLRRRKIKTAVLIAAAIIFLLSVSACTLEAKEYSDAVEFFNEYDLSTKGLSRKEIKAVYRDIKTSSFSYEKTDEVISQNSHLNHISGFELAQNFNSSLTGSSVNIPDYFFYYDYTDLSDNTRYEIEQKYKKIKENTDECEEVFEKSIIKKYKGKRLLWKTETRVFEAYGIVIFDDCVIAYGSNYFTENQSRDYMMKLSKDGKQLWTKCPETREQGYGGASIQKILQNKDKSFSVFHGNGNRIYLSLFDRDGKETPLNEYGFDGYIKNAALLSDGYIIEAETCYPDYKDTFYILDSDGNIEESFEYSDSEGDCRFFDIKEVGDKIYFSAYEVPKADNKSGSSHDEVANIADYIFSNHIWETADEEVTRLLRDNYTAMLLVCDRKNIHPKKFYRIKGALGAKLDTDDNGNLVWYTDSISSVRFSPYTSAYTFFGTSRIYRYIFSAKDASLIRSEKTDITNSFSK